MKQILILAPLVALSAFGCVSKSTYQTQVKKYQQLQRNYTSLEQQQESLKKSLELKKLDLKRVKQELADLMSRMAKIQERLRGAKGKAWELESRLKDTTKELTELQKAKLEAERIARTHKALMDQFKRMIQAGDLEIINRDGRLIIKLKAAILFPSGGTKLKAAGKVALADVAKVLAKIKGRHFQIAGHTDSDKVSSRKYRDNWLLSAYRAVEVVRFMQSKGVDPKSMSAAGYAEFQPLKSNDSEDHKRFNRRIEIQIIPEIPSFLKK